MHQCNGTVQESRREKKNRWKQKQDKLNLRLSPADVDTAFQIFDSSLSIHIKKCKNEGKQTPFSSVHTEHCCDAVYSTLWWDSDAILSGVTAIWLGFRHIDSHLLQYEHWLSGFPCREGEGLHQRAYIRVRVSATKGFNLILSRVALERGP